MNKHLIVSILAGTTAILSGIAQEPQRPAPPKPEGMGPQCPMLQQGEGAGPQCPMLQKKEGAGQQQCPMHPQPGGMNQQAPSMRGPMSEIPGQMPQMRGMANQGRQMPGEPTPRRLFADPEALKAAGATDEQILAFRKSMQDFRMKQIDLRANVEKAELNMQNLEQDPTSDEATLLKATDEVSKARAELLRQETLMKTKPKSIFGEEVVKKVFEANQKKQGPRPQQPQGADDQRKGPQRKDPGQRPPAPAVPVEK